MGFIKEEIVHPRMDVTIIVDEKAKGEEKEPYDIVSLDLSYGEIRKPDELIDLGNWLIDQGKRIKKQYTSTGKPRKIVKTKPIEVISLHITAFKKVKEGMNSIIKYGNLTSDVDDTIAITHDFAEDGEQIIKTVIARNDYFDDEDNHVFTALSF